MKKRSVALLLSASGLAGLAAWVPPGLAKAQPPVTAPASAGCDAVNLLAGRVPSETQDLRGSGAVVTDGVVGPEGASWDAPVAVTFGPGGSITYDFGQTRSIGALFIQADANDIYKLTGSVNGVPGSFTGLADMADVVDRGHGLRTRSVQFAPVAVRYLRVSPGTGDGMFSISELGAHCRAPAPFPRPFASRG